MANVHIYGVWEIIDGFGACFGHSKLLLTEVQKFYSLIWSQNLLRCPQVNSLAIPRLGLNSLANSLASSSYLSKLYQLFHNPARSKTSLRTLRSAWEFAPGHSLMTSAASSVQVAKPSFLNSECPLLPAEGEQLDLQNGRGSITQGW